MQKKIQKSFVNAITLTSNSNTGKAILNYSGNNQILWGCRTLVKKSLGGKKRGGGVKNPEVATKIYTSLE